MEKHELRQLLKNKRRGLNAGYIEDASRRIFEKLRSLSCVQDAKTALAYSDFGGEVKTGDLVEWLLLNRKKVYLPIVKGDGLELGEPGSAPLAVNHYGIAEPAIACKNAKADKLDIVFVPGLAFGRSGERLGFGKGYYDRLLSQCAPSCVKIGLAYDFQMVTGLPMQAHDVAMDLVVTQNEIIQVNTCVL